MLIDTSEVKSFRACRRQHLLSSRNRLHLRPKVTPKAFNTGKIFHEALHSLYLGNSLETVMEMVQARGVSDDDRCLFAMIPGYYEHVIPEDLETFKVLDIEHRFQFKPTDRDGNEIDLGFEICGSIDMIALNLSENKIYGFEHKSAKNFRDDLYLWMDEQPRLYTEALKRYIKKFNEAHPDRPPAEIGGIYINEVKKLLRKFSHKRSLCEYPKDDLRNFMEGFYQTALEIKKAVETNDIGMPCPGFMNCQLCSYVGICSTYMYSTIDLNELLDEFDMEFEVRKQDHLDEDDGKKGNVGGGK